MTKPAHHSAPVFTALLLLTSSLALAQDAGVADAGAPVGAAEGENCTCDDDCQAGLLCGDAEGALRCAAACDVTNPDCGPERVCVFAAREEGADAKGACVALPSGTLLPPATPCNRSEDCAAGTCVVASAIGRTVCRSSCTEEADCPEGYLCTDGVCTGATAIVGLSCDSLNEEEVRDDPVDEPAESTGCSHLRAHHAAPSLLAALPLLALLRRRRR